MGKGSRTVTSPIWLGDSHWIAREKRLRAQTISIDDFECVVALGEACRPDEIEV